MKARVRIEGGVMGQETRVFVVAEGRDDEVEISHCLTGVRVDIEVGEPTRASLDVLLVSGRYDAVVDDLVLRHVGPSRIGRLTWRLRKWWWRWTPRDATRFGDKQRKAV